MDWFLVRVILHDADTWEAYDELHAAMGAKGFDRVITSDDVAYHLPPAEYFRQGDLTVDAVHADAVAAATSTKKRFGLIVAQTNRLRWTRLDKVEPEPSSKG